jgi:hypothetical protein
LFTKISVLNIFLKIQTNFRATTTTLIFVHQG